MVASGMPLSVIGGCCLMTQLMIGEIVQSTNYQGFPVVKSTTDKTVIGFIRKNELRYALGTRVTGRS